MEAIKARVATSRENGVHNAKPAVISLTNASERGTVLPPHDVAQYGDLAKELGLATLDLPAEAGACITLSIAAGARSLPVGSAVHPMLKGWLIRSQK
jgi:hypothetical protein